MVFEMTSRDGGRQISRPGNAIAGEPAPRTREPDDAADLEHERQPHGAQARVDDDEHDEDAEAEDGERRRQAPRRAPREGKHGDDRGDRHDEGVVLLEELMREPASETLVKRGLNAGEWLREAAGIMGGKGGGRPDEAQGAGNDGGKLKEAMVAARLTANKKLHS